MIALENNRLFKEVNTLKTFFKINIGIFNFLFRRQIIKRLKYLTVLLKDIGTEMHDMDIIPEDMYLLNEKILFELKDLRERVKADSTFRSKKISNLFNELVSISYNNEKEARIKFYSQNDSSIRSEFTDDLSNYSRIVSRPAPLA